MYRKILFLSLSFILTLLILYLFYSLYKRSIKMKSYNDIVSIIIDNLEGGYFHPNMLLDGRLKDPNHVMSAGEGRKASGETMYGIDRANGGTINTTKDGVEFWGLIDKSNAKNTWKWNFKGGNLAPQLKLLVAKMILPTYETWCKMFLAPSAKEIIESDDRLFFHFIYAVWNGSGFFKMFADKFNSALESGITDKNKLVEMSIAERTNSKYSLIRESGAKIATIVNSDKFKNVA